MSSIHAGAAPRISIIIPALNEAETITATLLALQPLRAAGHEVIVVDGGSEDNTFALASPSADQVLHGPRGRGRQMNAGASAAMGNILLFLHADTQLPPGADALLAEGLAQTGRRWGRFDVRLSGRHPMLRVIGRMISWRSRLTGIASGDQAIFVCREWFERVGGYPEMPLMEDLALSRLLKRHGRPLCLRAPVVTSSRRWENRGIWRTIVLMWRLRLAYYLGADPARLASDYGRKSG
jgi:rSAM/selenodomain-associated transferase 2